MSDNSLKNEKIAFGALRNIPTKSREIGINDGSKHIFQ